MIEFLSSWAKNIGVTIVLVSILEMLLPNNKTKKYIRMVLGIFVIFNIISPLVQNKEKLKIKEIDLKNYNLLETTTINQTSMDERIKELSEQELEKDITKKLEKQGYKIITCNVTAQITGRQQDRIKKIKLNLEKLEIINNEDNNIENKLVTEVEKIKTINTKIKVSEENNEEKIIKLTNKDIENIKKFLIEEYGVSEKCLEIN